ncbi:hypothetical protein [Nocardia terpenica]|uniref:hypothetical protein n=1 Tax=Nocardia terpenica TaxID=455432 RepID=UPI001583FF28|nr:hypothetical protein [Nocardia terpenica]
MLLPGRSSFPRRSVDQRKVCSSPATSRLPARYWASASSPVQDASGWEKGHIERTLGSVGTLFAQFVADYAGFNTERRGRHVESEAVWSLLELQGLLDEWIVSAWQNRPHDGLRDSAHPKRMFSLNEKYAALIETAGYVPVALSAGDYVELLPSTWRAINAYGVKIGHRTYDDNALNPLQHQRSGAIDRLKI